MQLQGWSKDSGFSIVLNEVKPAFDETYANQIIKHAHGAPITAFSDEDNEIKPWEMIPENPRNDNRDREMVRMVHEGFYTGGQIAAKLNIAEQTLRNRLSALRTEYGPEIVPGLINYPMKGQW